MEEKKVKIVSNKKLVLFAVVLVLSIISLGVGVTYAYFVINFTGSASVSTNTAATLNVTSTLTNATAISSKNMGLIASSAVTTSAQKVSFSVTNASTSNVAAVYTVKLSTYTMSKNLSSKYFKWRLATSSGTEIASGNFFDSSIAAEGSTDKTTVTKTGKVLNSTARPLAISATDNLVFYIWLENDSAVSQMYLTGGSFSCKLSVEAQPSKS